MFRAAVLALSDSTAELARPPPSPPSWAARVPVRMRDRRFDKWWSLATPAPVTAVPLRVRVVRLGSDATASMVSSSTLAGLALRYTRGRTDKRRKHQEKTV